MFLGKNPGGIGAARRSEPPGIQGIESGGLNLMRTSNDVEPHNEMKNQQISELTDMVKTLLEEQRMLKQKLEIQELKMRESGANGETGSGLL